jgi:hypothetical protein
MRLRTILGIMALALVVILSGCTTTNLTTNTAGWSDYGEILTKDYEVVGHVRVEASETKTVSPLRITTTIEGSKVTYDALLREAIELGADDVINVRIDTVEDSSSGPLQWLTGYTTTYTYYGNGLAIAYREPVADAQATGTHDDADMGGRGFGPSGLPGEEFSLPFSLFALPFLLTPFSILLSLGQ